MIEDNSKARTRFVSGKVSAWLSLKNLIKHDLYLTVLDEYTGRIKLHCPWISVALTEYITESEFKDIEAKAKDKPKEVGGAYSYKCRLLFMNGQASGWMDPSTGIEIHSDMVSLHDEKTGRKIVEVSWWSLALIEYLTKEEYEKKKAEEEETNTKRGADHG